LYTPEERAEAVQFLKDEDLPVDTKRIALLVANNSGLSFPSLIQTTHFVFGVSEDYSVILVCDDPQLEMHIWNRIAEYDGLYLVHNTLYDLKIMYNRLRKLPKNYEDTALLAKCLINNAENWRAKVGLKDLMGSYYDPAWSLFNEYEPKNLKDPKFLMYAATDGGATFKLWELIQEELGADNER
jgi:DNA polymerase I-like protein with 3'-5' exonuclease and polymerase domains